MERASVMRVSLEKGRADFVYLPGRGALAREELDRIKNYTTVPEERAAKGFKAYEDLHTAFSLKPHKPDVDEVEFLALLEEPDKTTKKYSARAEVFFAKAVPP